VEFENFITLDSIKEVIKRSGGNAEELSNYINQLKEKIRQARLKAVHAMNNQLLSIY
jgi:hypothetical protein